MSQSYHSTDLTGTEKNTGMYRPMNDRRGEGMYHACPQGSRLQTNISAYTAMREFGGVSYAKTKQTGPNAPQAFSTHSQYAPITRQ